jgi:hypothetical protein
VGFSFLHIRPIIQLWAGTNSRHKEMTIMHDLLIALAFIGMVIAPAIVAANSNVDAEEDAE